MFRTGFAALVLAALTVPTVLTGCGDDETGSGGEAAAKSMVLESQTELFPGFGYSTGLQPAGSAVQASFAVSAQGAATVRAEAAASGSKSSPTLTGIPGTGSLAIEGGFALTGQLVIDVSGLPSYDGPIPGIENISIPVTNTASFDPFALDAPTSTRADIPAADLPGIPLPGGIPGQLVLAVAAGSFVDVSFAGTCAGIDGDQATYRGTLARGGTLVIEPRVEVEVPVLGTQTFTIPSFTIDMASVLGTSEVVMNADVKSFGAKPKGNDVEGSCSATGTGTDTGAGTSTATGTDTGSGTGTATGTSTGGGCESTATYSACFQCYAEQNPAGYDAYFNAFVYQCLCANECASSCTTDCADPFTETTSCNNCLGSLPGNSGCAVGLQDECYASGPCTSLLNNLITYCSAKP